MYIVFTPDIDVMTRDDFTGYLADGPDTSELDEWLRRKTIEIEEGRTLDRDATWKTCIAALFLLEWVKGDQTGEGLHE